MPRTCTICGHGEREAIDEALIAKEAYRHIASRFGTSTAALQRHQPHLRGDLVEANKAAGVERATSLLDDIHHSEARIEGLHGAVEMVLRRAFDAKGPEKCGCGDQGGSRPAGGGTPIPRTERHGHRGVRFADHDD